MLWCVWVKLELVKQHKAVKFQHYLSNEYDIDLYSIGIYHTVYGI